MGKSGLVIFPLLVSISTFGASILTSYVASRYSTMTVSLYVVLIFFHCVYRVIFSSARDHQLMEVFCGLHQKWNTPLAAILLNV